MTAIVIHAPKDLRLEQQDNNVLQPQEKEVLIDIVAGGICGSDLHYYNHGGFGNVRLKQPMVLGHEVAGRVAKLGAGVAHLSEGQAVAINPSRPCYQCHYCHQGQQNHCINMRFYGSAMPYPHIQGAFAQSLVVDARQCFPVSEQVSLNTAAFAEPFSVALHAVKRAGSLQGKRVIVTGCGPIGALVVLAARYHGALEIVVTDVLDYPLQFALAVGADKAVNVAQQTAADILATPTGQKGRFDVMIEASGNEQAIRSGLEWLQPQGILVQLGLGGEINLPQNLIVSKELEIRGAFRFHHEFAQAVELLAQQKVDVSHLLTATYPLQEAANAFEAAGDRRQAMKVQIDFSV